MCYMPDARRSSLSLINYETVIVVFIEEINSLNFLVFLCCINPQVTEIKNQSWELLNGGYPD